MLGKLMKYDMRYMARILPWLYLGSVGFSLFCAVLIVTVPTGAFVILDIMRAVLPSFCYLAMEVIIIMTVVVLIMRTYKSLYSDEGYLTFTLPVKNSSVIDAKILSGAIWSFITIAVAVLVYIIPQISLSVRYGANYTSSDLIDFPDITASADLSDALRGLVIIGLLILNVVVIAFLIPSLYSFCAAVVHKAKRARAFASIGMFIGISYGVIMIITVAEIIVITSLLAYAIPYSAEIIIQGSDTIKEAIFWYWLLIPAVPLVLTVPLTLVSWLASKHIVNKKLNLL